MDLSRTGWKKNAMTTYSGINTFILIPPSKIKVIMTCMRLMLRKDVLEQKVNQVLESVGYSSRGLVYTVYFTIQSTKKYSNGNVLGACLHGA